MKKTEISTTKLLQVAAIPVRVVRGVPEICLVTTRQTKRWTVPKGWPMKGKKDSRAAAIEAKEEAGLIGEIDKKSLGTFLYWKRQETHYELIRVAAYRLDVQQELGTWREAAQREKGWFPIASAARLVQESELSELLRNLVA